MIPIVNKISVNMSLNLLLNMFLAANAIKLIYNTTHKFLLMQCHPIQLTKIF